MSSESGAPLGEMERGQQRRRLEEMSDADVIRAAMGAPRAVLVLIVVAFIGGFVAGLVSVVSLCIAWSVGQ